MQNCNTTVMVSVICNTFNHERYIAQALESFVTQNTTFVFEVLVHDDASTDNTASIIKEYEARYPEIIKPIYQTENQYSKGVSITASIQIPRAQGKYIAFCEGDDYWISTEKLQKQVECLEQRPDASWCVCNAINVNRECEKISDYNVSEQTGEITTEYVIMKDGGFCATSSIMGRAQYLKNEPEFLRKFHLDMFVQYYLASCGKTICIAEQFAAYRRETEGSWSSRMKKNKDAYVRHKRRVIESLKAFDEYTQRQYHSAVQDKIDDVEFSLYRSTREFSKLRDEKYRKIYLSFQRREKIKLFLEIYFPWVLDLLWRIQGR